MKSAYLLAVILSAPLLQAANRYWTGGAGNGLLGDGLNWDSGTAPSTSDTLNFTNRASMAVKIADANGVALASHGTIKVSNGARLVMTPLYPFDPTVTNHATARNAPRDVLSTLNIASGANEPASSVAVENAMVKIVGASIGPGNPNAGTYSSNNRLSLKNCDILGGGNGGSWTLGYSTPGKTTNNWVEVEDTSCLCKDPWVTLNAYGLDSGLRAKGGCALNGFRLNFRNGASFQASPGTVFSFFSCGFTDNISQTFDRVVCTNGSGLASSVSIGGTNVLYEVVDSLGRLWPAFSSTSAGNRALITRCDGMNVSSGGGRDNRLVFTDSMVTNSGSGYLSGGCTVELHDTVMCGYGGHSAWGLCNQSEDQVTTLVVGAGSIACDGSLNYFVVGGDRYGGTGRGPATNNIVIVRDGGRLLVETLYIGRSYSGLNSKGGLFPGSNNWVKVFSGGRVAWGNQGSKFVENATKSVTLRLHGDGGLLLSDTGTYAKIGAGTVQTNASLRIANGATAVVTGALTFSGNARLAFEGDSRGDTSFAKAVTLEGGSKLEFEPETKAFVPVSFPTLVSAEGEGNTVLVHGRKFRRSGGGWVTLATYASNGSVPDFSLDPASSPANIQLEVTDTRIRAKVPCQGVTIILR